MGSLIHMKVGRTHMVPISGNFYVDYVSGNDDNNGTSALTPVKTIMTGLVENKWGTMAPVLSGDVVINMMSDQPVAAEQVVLRPIMGLRGFSIQQLLSGPGDAHHLATNLALGTITAKNRATSQRLKAVLNAPYPAGSLVTNLTHPSTAVIVSMSGNTATLSQPTGVFFTEVDTWALGDLVNITAPTKINLSIFDSQDNCAIYPAIQQLLNLECIALDGVAGDSSTVVGNNVGGLCLIYNCVFRTNLIVNGYADIFNCWMDPNPSAFLNGTVFIWGGDWTYVFAEPGGFDGVLIDGDAGVQRVFGPVRLGAVYVSQYIGLGTQGPSLNASTWLSSSLGGAVVLWGPGGVRAGSNIRGFYKVAGSTWTAQLLVTGPLVLAGAFSGQRYTISLGVGVWTDATALTVANLDTYGAIIEPKQGASFAIAT